MIRLVIYGLIAYLVYRWWKKKSSGKESIDRDRKSKPEYLDGAELVQDAECGVYFVKDKAVTVDINGKKYYFCSVKCRDNFLKKLENSNVKPSESDT